MPQWAPKVDRVIIWTDILTRFNSDRVRYFFDQMDKRSSVSSTIFLASRYYDLWQPSQVLPNIILVIKKILINRKVASLSDAPCLEPPVLAVLLCRPAQDKRTEKINYFFKIWPEVTVFFKLNDVLIFDSFFFIKRWRPNWISLRRAGQSSW